MLPVFLAMLAYAPKDIRQVGLETVNVALIRRPQTAVCFLSEPDWQRLIILHYIFHYIFHYIISLYYYILLTICFMNKK